MAQVLSDYLAAQRGRPFQWNVTDCFTLVAGWLDACTGKEALAEWRGLYSDEESVTRFISAGGGFEAIAGAFFVKHYAARPCPVGQGIAVLAQVQRRKVMGLRVDADHIAFRAHRGLLITKAARVLKEWSLPCRNF